MITEIVIKIVLSVLVVGGAVFGGVKYGKKSEAKKSVDHNNEVLNEHAEIDATPDPDDPAGQL